MSNAAGNSGPRRPSHIIRKCLDGAVAGGSLSQEEAERIAAAYERMAKQHGAAAKEKLVEDLRRAAASQERQALINEQVRERNNGFVTAFRDARGQQDPVKALTYLIEHHGEVNMPEGMTSVAATAKALEGDYKAGLEAMLWEFRPQFGTGQTRQAVRFDKVVRELAGEGGGDATEKAFAKAWHETAERMRQEANAAGADIPKLEGWFLPQVHDRLALLAIGKDRWVSELVGRYLDLDKIERVTGIDRAEIEPTLGRIWENITSDGHGTAADNAANPFGGVTSRRGGQGSYLDQREQHRFLHYKDADTWLAYQRELGGGADPFKAMMQHVTSMSKDTAARLVLGNNPEAELARLANFALKQAAFSVQGSADAIFPKVGEITGRSLNTKRHPEGAEGYARDGVATAEAMWDAFRGSMSAPVHAKFAETMQAARNIGVIARGGSMVISSMADNFAQILARQFIGAPIASTFTDIVKQFTAGNRREAMRAGLIAEQYLHMHNEGARASAAMHGKGWSNYLAERTIALQGLGALTDAQRGSFGMATQGLFADLAKYDWAALGKRNANLQRMLERYGIGAEGWDKIRLDASGKPHQVDFLSPNLVRGAEEAAGRAGDRMYQRYLGMILQETDFASPQSMLRARAAMYGKTRPGTIAGEGLRTLGQFKTFAVMWWMLHVERSMREMVQNGAVRGGAHAAATFATMALGGALVVQLKNIRSGKDPEPVDTPKFWGRAMLQGGGLGLMGDLLASETNRFGGGVMSTVGGPVTGMVDDVLRPVMSNIKAASEGKKTTIGRDVARLATSYVPGSSLWYTSLAWQRIVGDGLQRALDPEAYKSFQTRMQNQKREYGNNFFWRPGEMSPRRLPQYGGR